MKTTTTKHPEIGYINNIEIVAKALREQFGFDDQSYMMLAVSAHIWSAICHQYAEEKTWGTQEIINALAQCRMRLSRMEDTIKCSKSGCAIGYPHIHH